MSRITKQDYFKTFKNQSYFEQLQKIERKFESFRNDATNTTEFTIYGIIGDSWWEDSVSASDIDNALKTVNGDITINLNSPGGDAFDGITIYNRLKKHDGKVTINVDGWACSAASVIAMAADELVMGLGSMLMIHEASSFVWGTKTDMRKEAGVLDELEEGIIDIYMTKSNISREEIRNMVDAETWFSAQKAIDIGFATSIANAATGSKDDEITQLKAQLNSMQSELYKLKNQSKNEDPKPVVTAGTRIFF
ncbi:ATP-dependent Clp protease proteolytic subunit [Paenibacillus alvei]|uniref:ATP-dependent Clp protease proteolytic subunit n=1 Tax=Paenibacillus alvei TaxID=44250 RepID=A0ABT4H7D0_PAEAL|nr:head maturation protease, ClpP-related [Paenibacillus alvei]EJW14226.1 protease subunit of ATP-dependent Clp protease [Paenibacillus alvei DSM 29]MCY9544919.1 ATP-dependent Clp protease proteolytic subunit [Paenibacillus alvei]MCY9708750.1 ATP-dependent Clp protease proteolytic subunit [Paenibacillus alvei]MCY9737968.1 ATP-dependent Clp protease proteolytic subunit [Paenibacillus alvei]MCY9758928.1 ATP-dependent Clp protease proteolytic subunit [Paenibacillus alvei]